MDKSMVSEKCVEPMFIMSWEPYTSHKGKCQRVVSEMDMRAYCGQQVYQVMFEYAE